MLTPLISFLFCFGPILFSVRSSSAVRSPAIMATHNTSSPSLSPRSVQMSKLTHEEKIELCRKTASTLATRGKGILAADEGPEHWPSRFAAIGIHDNTMENRKAWRQVLFGSTTEEEYPFAQNIR
jgi:hypothetical protein